MSRTTLVAPLALSCLVSLAAAGCDSGALEPDASHDGGSSGADAETPGFDAGRGGGTDAGGLATDAGGRDGGGAGPPAPIAATGQTECFSMSGDVIDCAGTGQDGETRAGVAWPRPRFVVRGDGTVRDSLTGLVWLQRANCVGEMPWAEALIRANALADGECDLSDGSSAGDWRLPNLNELSSLIDVSSGYPALSNVEGTAPMDGNEPFRGVQNRPHWTSTTRARGRDRAWIVSPFASGGFRGEGKDGDHWVWPVRDDTEPGTITLPVTNQTTCYDTAGDAVDCAGTGQDGELQRGVAWPVPRFTVGGDGTVHDNLTGLVWLRDADCLAEAAWSDAFANTGGLADGQCGLSDGSTAGDWRVPNFRELFSLMDWSRDLTLADTEGTGAWSDGDPFTDVVTMLHWTSTTLGGDDSGQWTMSPFASGNIHGGGRAGVRFVWPVRN